MKIGTDLVEAARLLEAGALVAVPTETVYGLAANAFDEKAVASIFEAKNRPSFDPLIVHTDTLEKAVKLTSHFPERAMKLARAFWPGPLTLVLPKSNAISYLVTSGLDTVGLRIPRHALTQKLLSRLSFPLAAPSANPFGYISPTRPEHVAAQLGHAVQYILDGGACEVGVESTVVSFRESVPEILRMGGTAVEDIERLVGEVLIRTHSTSAPEAPGMLTAHYAPRKKLMLGNIDELAVQQGARSYAVLAFSDTAGRPGMVLSPSGNMNEAARNLFGALRELDALPCEVIIAEEVPDHGLGRAINDRLRRAAAG